MFLLFEIALKYLKKDYNDVLNMYTDLESLTSKIQVVNKQALKVTDIEDRVVSPEDIQPKINAILEKQ